jgi:cysteine desulfurase / selenocysteine lyase
LSAGTGAGGEPKAAIDVKRVRDETAGCVDTIHFNNAGCSLAADPVFHAVVDHLELERRIGGYEAAERAADRIRDTYEALARLLNCGPDEIACVENATRAWDMAFYAFAFRPGDRILTGRSEYASNYIAFLQTARRCGVAIDVVPDDETGQLSLRALEEMVDDRVKLIAITHVGTQSGLVNPAAGVGRIARAHGIPFLLDACQSVGQMPIDVEAIGCDILSATGRKYLRGPRGTGFLYVRGTLIENLEPPFLDLHAATWTGANAFEIRPGAQRFETFENYVAGRIGLGVAADYACDLGLDLIAYRVRRLAATLRDGLSALSGVTVRDRGAELCGIVTFTKEGETASAIRRRLARYRINVSVSVVAAARLDLEARGLPELVRASVHYYNTEEEIARFLAALV